MNKPLGIFLVGGPGSGKDYLLKNIFSRFDLIEVQIDHVLNGSADQLIEQNKNIVINGALDSNKIAEASALLENYNLDAIYVSVTNKVSRLRNSLRENPIAENKRVEKWYRAEKLAESMDCFTFNNSINLNESNEFEKVFFADQIAKLLERITDHGLELQEIAEVKTFAPVVKHKSGLPKKYVGSLSSSTALKRKAHWKKMSKYSDRDPRAYKPAPGDAKAKTKLSKYTKKYHAMFGEQIEADVKVPPTVQSIAKKHNVSVASIIDALKVGTNVELEHTNDQHTAEIIALTHLDEKPDYYTKLAQMEQMTSQAQVDAARYTTPEKARKMERAREVHHFRDVHRREKESHRIAVAKEEVELEEGKADTSLAAKSKKSGVSLSTLKKVYRRGVAAWNSGHRPGTTPSQWGHARVNSYITKGKTYHTADKDLREEVEILDEASKRAINITTKDLDLIKSGDHEKVKNHMIKLISRAADSKTNARPLRSDKAAEFLNKIHASTNVGQLQKMAYNMYLGGDDEGKSKYGSLHVYKPEYKAGRSYQKRYGIGEETETEEDINELFEMQLIGTDSYRKHAIAMTPGQSQDIENAYNGSTEISGKNGNEDCGCEGDDCNCEETETNESREYISRDDGIFSEEKEEVIDATPTLKSRPVKKSDLKVPGKFYRSSMDGLPVVSKLSEEVTLEEAVQYHLENKISFTENVFRPGSDMFFQMIGEAKRLYSEGQYKPKDEWERDMLGSNIGEKAIYEGQEVILDYPFEEGLNEEDKTNGKGIGKPWQEGGGGAVYVRVGDSVRKISFSKSGMKKKYMDPAATRSFVARHRCLTNKDKTSASYWACRWPRFFSNSGKIWW